MIKRFSADVGNYAYLICINKNIYGRYKTQWIDKKTQNILSIINQISELYKMDGRIKIHPWKRSSFNKVKWTGKNQFTSENNVFKRHYK